MYKMKQICVFLLFIYVTVVLGNPVQNDYDVRGAFTNRALQCRNTATCAYCAINKHNCHLPAIRNQCRRTCQLCPGCKDFASCSFCNLNKDQGSCNNPAFVEYCRFTCGKCHTK